MPRTDVIISAKTQGFERVHQQTGRMAQEARKILEVQTRGFDKLQKGIGQTVSSIKGLEKSLQAVGDRMKKITDQMGQDLNKQARQMQQQGAFLQGLAQGIGGPAAMFMQRGPGMGRQIAGQMVGRAGRGIVGGALATPFTGLGGLSTALSAIPGGGIIAGQLQTVMGYSQKALSLQRSRVGAISQLGIAPEALAASRAGRAGGRRSWRQKMTPEAQAALLREASADAGVNLDTVETITDDRMRNLRENRAKEMASKFGPDGPSAHQKKILDVISRNSQEFDRGKVRESVLREERDRVMRDAQAETREKIAKGEGRAGAAGAARARRNLFSGIRGAGTKYLGITEQEAIQQAVSIAQAGGGGLADLRQQGMLDTGFAAQAAFGVDSGVSGAFLQAGRRGGLSGLTKGTKGGAGDALASAIGDAMKLGLEGSEINDYLQQMAAGITQWKQTGIPFAKESVAAFGQELGKMGMAGGRGSVVARSFANAAQGLSTRGPQSAQDLLMMQMVGGFNPGSGAAGFEEAQIELEQLKGGQMSGKKMSGFMRRLIQAGGGGASGRLFARQSLGKMGINLGAKEMREMGTRLESGEMLNPEDVLGKRGNIPQTGADIQKQAAQTMNEWGGALKRQAAIQNKQAMAGERMLGILNNLESTQTRVADGFSKLVDGPLTKMTALLDEIVKQIENGRSFADVITDLVTP